MKTLDESKVLSLCFWKWRMRKGGESKISLFYFGGLGASHQSFRERGGVI